MPFLGVCEVSVFRNSSSFLLYSLGGVVVVAAITLSVVRLVIPYADDFSQQIQSAISDQVGRDVSIGQIDASWHHFKPQIELENVVIALADEQTLEFGRVSLGVDIIGSFLQRGLVTRDIRLAGFEVNIIEAADGRLAMVGLTESKKPSSEKKNKALLRWLSRQQQVVIENGTLYFTSERKPELLQIFSRVGVYFVRADDEYQIAVQADLPPSLGKSVELIADFDGFPLLDADWSAQSYLKFEQFSVMGLAKDFLSSMLDADKVKGGEVDLELWAEIDSNRSVVAQGRIAAENLWYGAESSMDFGGELIINSLTADYALQKTGDAWAMALEPLRLSRVGASEQTFDVQMRYNNDAQDRSLLLAVGAYDANEFLDLVKAGPFLSSQQLESIENISFGGQVSHTTFHWQPGNESKLALYAEFDNAFIQKSEKLPGLDGINGYVSYQDDAGQLYLSAASSTFDAPQWFRDSLEFDELKVDAGWMHLDKALLFDFTNIVISNSDLSVKGDAFVRAPIDKALSPYIDLALSLERADVSQRSRYLPAKIMRPKALKWYDRALKKGQVSKGVIALKGPLKRFPFKTGGGEFVVDLHIDDGELDYAKGWPVIENISADLSIHNASVDLALNKGVVINTDLTSAHMSVSDFTKKPTAMTIVSTVVGDSADALLFIDQSPLKQRFEKALKVLNVEGDSTLALKLDITLPGLAKVYGELELTDNRLSIADGKFVAENIDGTLSFDNQGLYGEAIAADIFGMRALVDLEPVVKDTGRGTHFSVTGEGNIEQYAKLSGLSWLTKMSQGKSAWKADVTIIGDRPEIYVESDMVGVSSQFPYPLSKREDDVKHFSMATVLPFGSEPVSLSFGERIHAELSLKQGNDGGGLALLNVGLGGEPEKLIAGSEGMVVNGSLDEFVLEDWINASGQLFDESQSGDPLPMSINASVDSLDVFDYRWANVRIEALQRKGDWQVSLLGEGLIGDVKTTVVDSDVHITLAMERLALAVNEDDGSAGKVLAGGDLDPRDTPTVDVRIQQFSYGDFELGELAFKTSKVKQGQHIKDIALRTPNLLLAGAGNWTQVANKQRSSFNVSAETSDLSAMLDDFDYAVENVDGGATKVDANVFWQGMPTSYGHEKLNGQLDLSIKNISFSDIDPGAGRVFGLLSIQALPQRLSLDFSDLFKKGLKINTIKGHFVVKNGDAVTDDLVMKGPAARIDIAGRIGLVEQDYDQVMAVTPAVSSSLPLVGAAVAGPAGAGIGTAIMFLHKLFNPKILHYKYQVSGSWQDPEVTLLSTAKSQDKTKTKKNSASDDASKAN